MDDIDFASWADDIMLYATGSDMEELIVKLQNASKTFLYALPTIKWTQHRTSVILPVVAMKKLLGIKIHAKLFLMHILVIFVKTLFNAHTGDICKKAGWK